MTLFGGNFLPTSLQTQFSFQDHIAEVALKTISSFKSALGTSGLQEQLSTSTKECQKLFIPEATQTWAYESLGFGPSSPGMAPFHPPFPPTENMSNLERNQLFY
jgi:hypothetical protein